jgi:magnesium transporter
VAVGLINTVLNSSAGALSKAGNNLDQIASVVFRARLLLFLLAEGRPSNAPKAVREATRAALRDLNSLEEDASFKAQKIQFHAPHSFGGDGTSH